jgi:predicted glycoside hydrolase/deacetylase ChbG (UPF0249 family)
VLFVNADDLGWTAEITDRILKCYLQGSIHASSAMTFMKDSERAADLALEKGLPVGLHLNFIQELTDEKATENLSHQQGRIAEYLKARKFNQLLFNPTLHNAFEYVFQAQWDEFCRLYGKEPGRLDGHHHMHLCMNMLVSGRFPKGIRIRRNFTFKAGEKNVFNRLYRYLVDRWLKRRFKCTDYFYSLRPVRADRIKGIVQQSKTGDVELMAHPGDQEEFRFLSSDVWESIISDSADGTVDKSRECEIVVRDFSREKHQVRRVRKGDERLSGG